MLKILITILACFGFLISSYSQTYIPREVANAIENGSRTKAGIPGEKYFQNSSDYSIDVRFDPEKGKLRGDAKIMYFNNSPDTLKKVVIRLYQNISEKGALRNRAISKADVHDGVKITRLKLNGLDYYDQMSQKVRNKGTNMEIGLAEFLFPDDSLEIDIRWNFKMPSEHLYRFGKYGDGNYFVAFWYPQLAVYDDIVGWDKLDYTGTQEFYNDFAKFDVRIHVPKNYVVHATGELQNASEIYTPVIVQRIEKAKTSDDIVQIIQPGNIEEKDYHSDAGTNHYHYLADSVPDFAFSISDNYLWDASSIVVDSATNRRVIVMASYAEATSNFDSVVAIGRQVVHQLSYSSYGVPYPYPQVTVYSGEGGMEFPMIVNDGPTIIYNSTLFVTMHEIAHAYFPFLTGINERVYSWIDEGLTTYLPMETERVMGSNYYSIEHVAKSYNRFAGTFHDVPLYVSAMQTRGAAYQVFSYLRACMAFSMMESYIGKEEFRSGIREFINIWQYKHPTGNDLFAVLKNNTEKEIDWLIDSWFYGAGYADQEIDWVAIDAKSLRLQIQNVGAMPAPIVLSFKYEKGEEEKVEVPADVWRENDVYIYSGQIREGLESITLGSGAIPDKYPENNFYKVK